ncbi:hypothetical protein COU74_03705 [Candidatus Peregrinibacteria bacterium CG10_big_fil_rev_8_21_14_0_10_36_19]|nr:MAG: hypothetical protein COU74_03705 [Candidatus Peregrinibacteria bacterium CG10_big_fil_rev_8_21_14_0_10_36_19]
MSLLLKPFIGIILNGISLFGLTYFVDDITYTGGLTFFIIGSVLMWLLNTIVKPLIKIVSLPLIFLSAGFFLIIINIALLFFFSYFLEVAAFRDASLIFANAGSYVIGAIVFGLLNWTLDLFFK